MSRKAERINKEKVRMRVVEERQGRLGGRDRKNKNKKNEIWEKKIRWGEGLNKRERREK